MATMQFPSIRKLSKRIARNSSEGLGDGFVAIRGIKHSPPRKCIFCGSTPLTREHLWPDWLRKYLPRDMPNYSMLKAEVRDVSARGNVRVQGGDIHHRKVKCVCATCNNGWMSRLEQEAKLALAPLLELREVRVTVEMQNVLATWFALKAIVAEYDHDAPRISFRDERQKIMKKRLPPTDWRMLVGEYQRKNWPGRWVNTPLSIVEGITAQRERAVRHNSQSLTFIVGNVYFILLRSRMKGFVSRIQLGPAHSKLRQIWPSSALSFRWPLSSLTDAEASGMADFLLNFSLRIIKQKRNASEG